MEKNTCVHSMFSGVLGNIPREIMSSELTSSGCLDHTYHQEEKSMQI